MFLSSLKGFGFRDRVLSVLADEVLPAGAGAVPESVTSYKNRKNGILNTFFTLLQNFWTGEERERERESETQLAKHSNIAWLGNPLPPELFFVVFLGLA